MNKENESKSNKPEHKIRIGNMTATIWKNTIEGKNGAFVTRSVNLERSYKDKDGNWQNTTSIRAVDLPKALYVLDDAYRFCLTNKSDDNETLE